MNFCIDNLYKERKKYQIHRILLKHCNINIYKRFKMIFLFDEMMGPQKGSCIFINKFVYLVWYRFRSYNIFWKIDIFCVLICWDCFVCIRFEAGHSTITVASSTTVVKSSHLLRFNMEFQIYNLVNLGNKQHIVKLTRK